MQMEKIVKERIKNNRDNQQNQWLVSSKDK